MRSWEPIARALRRSPVKRIGLVHLLVVVAAACSSSHAGRGTTTTTARRSLDTSTSRPPTTTPRQTSTTTATATGRFGEPVLGRIGGPYERGYGEVRPSRVDNGGDGQSFVADVHWESWGGARATGTGVASYVAPHQFSYQGRAAVATVVAFNLGNCHGILAYRDIEWYFPQHGETFDPKRAWDMCVWRA